MKIFIDAGHNFSGFNTGAVGNGTREQDLTFAISKKLGDILSKRGLEIKLSRPTLETNLGADNTSSINTRIRMANDWGADYFISIHVNAGGGTGAETLYNKADSLDFAKIIQRNYVKNTGLRDRGVKFRNDIGVLIHTKMPAILLEAAFIDHPQDALFLKNNQDKIAEAIASGFYELLGIEEDEPMKRFNTLEEMPSWAKPTIEKLINRGFLQGDGQGLNLSEDMIRIFVINDRAGLYD